MTMLHEEIHALRNAEQFLMDLLNIKKTPRVPRKVRLRAAAILRHYPGKYAISMHWRGWSK